MTPKFLQIGEVAERTGLTQRTIRFYEEKGILDPPTRMEGGFRLYSQADVERIKGISQLRQLLCFSLEQMKELVLAENLLERPQPNPSGDTATELAHLHAAIEVMRAQSDHIEEKFQQLKQLRSKWRQRLAAYQDRYGALRSGTPAEAAGRK